MATGKVAKLVKTVLFDSGFLYPYSVNLHGTLLALVSYCTFPLPLGNSLLLFIDPSPLPLPNVLVLQSSALKPSVASF